MKGHYKGNSPRENIEVNQEERTKLPGKGNTNALDIWQRDVQGCVHGEKKDNIRVIQRNKTQILPIQQFWHHTRIPIEIVPVYHQLLCNAAPPLTQGTEGSMTTVENSTTVSPSHRGFNQPSIENNWESAVGDVKISFSFLSWSNL